MWPWEHAAVGYLAFSVYGYVRGRVPRTDELLALLFATQFPDLVDKPLAWTFGVLPSGTSVAHSVFVATPLSVLVYLVARRLGRPGVGVAFAVGYLLHLPADALYVTITSGTPLSYGGFIWPFGSGPPNPRVNAGLLETTAYYLGRYREFLDSPRAVVYLAAELLLLGSALLAWVRDGKPGLSRK